jgi:Zn-dependent protease with chaperone function
MASMIDDETPTPRPWVPDRPVTADRPPYAEERPRRPYDEARPWRPVAGPADRVSFFAERARRRRATWQLGAASTLAVVLAGLPLSLVVTPLVFLAIILFTKLISLVVPLSPAIPDLYRSVAMAIGNIMTLVEIVDTRSPTSEEVGGALAGAVALLALLAPGILTMLALWLMLRRLFSGAGVGALVSGLGAREPRPADFEERQLVNVVEEMAIAAGLPAPRVMLFDGDIANAAVVGSSPNDAVVIVSRRLLDEMDRDETQGVLAHLVASIGNGDLGIALMMVTVFRTFGLVNVLVDTPISSSARATLRRLIAVAFFGRGKADDAARAAEVAALLGSRVDAVEMEDVDLVLGSEEQQAKAPRGLAGLLVKIRVWVFFPIWAAGGMAKTGLMLLIFGVLSPLLALTWRTRRYLADTTAVQLTRNPDAVAGGLRGLTSRGGGMRGGAWADHLFVVGGARIGQEGASEIGGNLGWLSPHPSLKSRLKRLQALGAYVDERVFSGGMTPTQVALMILVGGPIGLLIGALMTVALTLATGLVIVFMMIPMALIYFLFEWLF